MESGNSRSKLVFNKINVKNYIEARELRIYKNVLNSAKLNNEILKVNSSAIN